MRPMYHFTEYRIEAHICICFIASYKVYKEFVRDNNKAAYLLARCFKELCRNDE